VAGEATTAFIGQHRNQLLSPRSEEPWEVALAALLLHVTDRHAPSWKQGRTLVATFPSPARIEFNRRIHELEIVRERDGGYAASCNGNEIRFEIDELGADSIRFRIDGMTKSARFCRDGDRLYFLHHGLTLSIRDLTLAAPASATTNGGDGRVRAAMNGRVAAILVRQGQRVKAGQPVMTLEAMKMEHVHTAPVSGIISAIHVAEGEQVTTGKIVVQIDADHQPNSEQGQ
jgi:geranyl-CoA carboxylase alpha subunit